MGVEYFGVLFEDKNLLIVVRLASHPVDEEKHKNGAEKLLQLLSESSTLLSLIKESENIQSYGSMYSLLRIAKLLEDATRPIYMSVVLYYAFCKYFNIKPRIVNEFYVFPEHGRRKRVCVLGERCYE